MSVKTKLVGTGITRREELHVEGTQGGAGLAEVAEEQRGHAALFASVAADPRDEARAFCEEIAGDRREKWPAAAKRMATAKTDEEREQARAERDEVRPPDVDTPEWFAEKILEQLDHAVDQRVMGRHDEAEQWAFLAGLLFGVAGVKFEWESDAMRGEKVRFGGKAGHEATHGTPEEKKARWDRHQTAVNEAREQNPAASKAEVRRIASEKTGVSVSTLRRHTTDKGRKK